MCRISREAFNAGGRATADGANGNAYGPARVRGLLARRMRQLGLEPLFHEARTPGTVGPEWVEKLTAKIEARRAA